MPLSKEEIENRVGFHKATVEGENATLPKHRELRLAFRGFMELLNEILPDGRAKSVTMTELETVSMWAHKSIAEMAPLVPESYRDPIQGLHSEYMDKTAQLDLELELKNAKHKVDQENAASGVAENWPRHNVDVKPDPGTSQTIEQP